MKADKPKPMIKQDPKNYRKHSDKNKRVIKKSLDELGAGRSILTDADDCIIAGNGVAEQWGDRPVKVIETDGTELIVVKRTDITTDDKKRKELALVDNHASDTSDFDFDIINDDFEKEELDKWGIDNSGYFQQQLQNDTEQQEKMPYPVTIVVTENDYCKWLKLKEKYRETNDLKLFLRVLKEINI